MKPGVDPLEEAREGESFHAGRFDLIEVILPDGSSLFLKR